MKTSKKSQLELSANFLVIIIISIVILGAGLTIFFKVKSSASNYVDTLDQQSSAKIKSIMLQNNELVSVYPNQVSLDPGKIGFIGLGINSNIANSTKFKITVTSINYFSKPSAAPVNVVGGSNWIVSYPTDCTMGTTNSVQHPRCIDISALGYIAKNIAVKMPSNANKGQYVVTLKIENGTIAPSAWNSYGVVQIFVERP